jgi:predicted choloylglycine hydrolase
MKKQLLNEQFVRMQRLAGVLNENENPTGLITFEQLKQACVNNYDNYVSGFDDEEDLHQPFETGLDDTNNIDELVNILDGMGFNGDEAYDFIFSSILK